MMANPTADSSRDRGALRRNTATAVKSANVPQDEADDFRAFTGSEHMFFGLQDPFGMIREETEDGLRRQVADTVLERIETFGKPKFFTLGRKTGDPSTVIVAHFAFAVRARLSVSSAAGTAREVLDAALTFLFGNVDVPGSQVCRTYFDFHDDADSAFEDEIFRDRFLEFRAELAERPQ
jgi:hypothetical protein